MIRSPTVTFNQAADAAQRVHELRGRQEALRASGGPEAEGGRGGRPKDTSE